jgi:hypothetical protein
VGSRRLIYVANIALFLATIALIIWKFDTNLLIGAATVALVVATFALYRTTDRYAQATQEILDETRIASATTNSMLNETKEYVRATQRVQEEAQRAGRLSEYELTLRTLPFLHIVNANDGYLGTEPFEFRNLGGSPAVSVWARGLQGEHEPTTTTKWVLVGFVVASQERRRYPCRTSETAKAIGWSRFATTTR